MSGVPYHGWTHRPKAQGGTDPIDVASPVIWATRAGTTQTVTTPWTVDAIPVNSASMATNDLNNEFFEETQDGNGVNGIRIIQEGVYRFQLGLIVSFPANTGTRILPTFCRATLIYQETVASNFTTSKGFGNACNYVVPAGTYLPDDTDGAGLSSGLGLVLQSHTFFSLLDLNSGFSNVPINFAWRVQSVGGTEDWTYLGSFAIWRIDDATTSEIQ